MHKSNRTWRHTHMVKIQNVWQTVYDRKTIACCTKSHKSCTRCLAVVQHCLICEMTIVTVFGPQMYTSTLAEPSRTVSTANLPFSLTTRKREHQTKSSRRHMIAPVVMYIFGGLGTTKTWYVCPPYWPIMRHVTLQQQPQKCVIQLNSIGLYGCRKLTGSLFSHCVAPNINTVSQCWCN